jgi:hypothetical protein
MLDAWFGRDKNGSGESFRCVVSHSSSHIVQSEHWLREVAHKIPWLSLLRLGLIWTAPLMSY